MVDKGGDVSSPPPPDEYLADAGYTYFGQFLDHDLTEMNPLQDLIGHVTDHLHNLQSPRLDLSHLYGDDFSVPGAWYEDDRTKLKIGPSGSKGHSFDVFFDHGKQMSLLADDRSGENVIIRQMVAVFLRLHNAAVKQFGNFNDACQKMRWQFQYLVVEDYLRRILDYSVYQKVFGNRDFHFEWQEFSIPVEFAAAAMRFGHSMVRANYLFGSETDQGLKAVLDRTRRPGQLEDEWQIAWGHFFQGAGGSSFAMTSRPIDTLVAEPLHDLSFAKLQLFTVSKLGFPLPAKQIRLPVLTLLRGEQFKLASGQTAASELGVEPLSDSELLRTRGNTPSQGEVLRDFGLLSNTPLWYYILKESEVRSNGSNLGPVGSHIMAETVAGALRNDSTSYWNASPPIGGWPPLWRIDDETFRIPTLTELFRLAPRL